MPTSDKALKHAEAQLGFLISTGEGIGYTRGRDKRRRKRTAISRLRVFFTKVEQTRQRGVLPL